MPTAKTHKTTWLYAIEELNHWAVRLEASPSPFSATKNHDKDYQTFLALALEKYLQKISTQKTKQEKLAYVYELLRLLDIITKHLDVQMFSVKLKNNAEFISNIVKIIHKVFLASETQSAVWNKLNKRVVKLKSVGINGNILNQALDKAKINPSLFDEPFAKTTPLKPVPGHPEIKPKEEPSSHQKKLLARLAELTNKYVLLTTRVNNIESELTKIRSTLTGKNKELIELDRRLAERRNEIRAEGEKIRKLEALLARADYTAELEKEDDTKNEEAARLAAEREAAAKIAEAAAAKAKADAEAEIAKARAEAAKLAREKAALKNEQDQFNEEKTKFALGREQLSNKEDRFDQKKQAFEDHCKEYEAALTKAREKFEAQKQREMQEIEALKAAARLAFENAKNSEQTARRNSETIAINVATSKRFKEEANADRKEARKFLNDAKDSAARASDTEARNKQLETYLEGWQGQLAKEWVSSAEQAARIKELESELAQARLSLADKTQTDATALADAQQQLQEILAAIERAKNELNAINTALDPVREELVNLQAASTAEEEKAKKIKEDTRKDCLGLKTEAQRSIAAAWLKFNDELTIEKEKLTGLMNELELAQAQADTNLASIKARTLVAKQENSALEKYLEKMRGERNGLLEEASKLKTSIAQLQEKEKQQKAIMDEKISDAEQQAKNILTGAHQEAARIINKAFTDANKISADEHEKFEREKVALNKEARKIIEDARGKAERLDKVAFDLTQKIADMENKLKAEANQPKKQEINPNSFFKRLPNNSQKTLEATLINELEALAEFFKNDDSYFTQIILDLIAQCKTKVSDYQTLLSQFNEKIKTYLSDQFEKSSNRVNNIVNQVAITNITDVAIKAFKALNLQQDTFLLDLLKVCETAAENYEVYVSQDGKREELNQVSGEFMSALFDLIEEIEQNKYPGITDEQIENIRTLFTQYYQQLSQIAVKDFIPENLQRAQDSFSRIAKELKSPKDSAIKLTGNSPRI